MGANGVTFRMPLVETDAIVLHVFDYSETSRILRLATRDAGLQSVLARGARRSKSRWTIVVWPPPDGLLGVTSSRGGRNRDDHAPWISEVALRHDSFAAPDAVPLSSFTNPVAATRAAAMTTPRSA